MDPADRGRGQDDAAVAAVLAQARAHEPDRYLAALLAPRAVRLDLLALAAFAAELRQLPARVNEPMMGEIRLQWWMDSIAAGSSSGSRTGNPIADRLNITVQQHRLPVALFAQIIDAERAALYGPLHIGGAEGDAALMAHLAAVEGGLFALAARIAMPDAQQQAVAIAAAARAGGQAYGLARLLSALPLALSRGRVALADGGPAHAPQQGQGGADAVGKLAGVRQRQISRLRGMARDRLREARGAARPLSRRGRNAFLPLALVEPYLQASERNVEPLRDVVELLPLVRVGRVWLWHMLGKF